jgi:hypothetical protein
MSLLILPTVENAKDEVKDIYTQALNNFGMVPNGLRLWGVSPQKLKMQWGNMMNDMSKDPENLKLKVIMRYILANKDSCEYCIGFNKGMLMNMFKIEESVIDGLENDPSTAPLDEKHLALLLFSLRAYKDAHSIQKEDIDMLKKLGTTEEEIFDAVYAASYTHVVNTLFETFNIEAV